MTQSPSFQIGISRSHIGTFILDEDALKRLHAQIEKHAKSLLREPTVAFFVEREDDRFYETTEIDEVLSDPNLPGARICGLALQCGSSPTMRRAPWDTDHFSIEVAFGRIKHNVIRVYSLGRTGETIAIRITSHDRNWALVASEAIEVEVKRVIDNPHPNRTASYCIPVATFLLMSALLKVMLDVRHGTSFLTGLHLGQALTISLPITIGVVMTLFSLFHLADPPASTPKGIRGILLAESVFLWGAELRDYPARRRFKRNVVWGVLVAFFVSLLAGLVQWGLFNA